MGPALFVDIRHHCNVILGNHKLAIINCNPMMEGQNYRYELRTVDMELGSEWVQVSEISKSPYGHPSPV